MLGHIRIFISSGWLSDHHPPTTQPNRQAPQGGTQPLRAAPVEKLSVWHHHTERARARRIGMTGIGFGTNAPSLVSAV